MGCNNCNGNKNVASPVVGDSGAVSSAPDLAGFKFDFSGVLVFVVVMGFVIQLLKK